MCVCVVCVVICRSTDQFLGGGLGARQESREVGKREHHRLVDRNGIRNSKKKEAGKGHAGELSMCVPRWGRDQERETRHRSQA